MLKKGLCPYTARARSSHQLGDDIFYVQVIKAWGDVLDKYKETLLSGNGNANLSKFIHAPGAGSKLDGVIINLKTFVLNPDQDVLKAVELVENKEITPKAKVEKK